MKEQGGTVSVLEYWCSVVQYDMKCSAANNQLDSPVVPYPMKVVPAIAKNKKSRIRSIAKHCTIAPPAPAPSGKTNARSDTQRTT